MVSLMTSAEVAAQLGIEVSDLENWRTHGQGPTWLRIGSQCIRYLDTDVVQWLRDQAQHSAPQLRVERFGQ